jgi:hypothetical protein
MRIAANRIASSLLLTAIVVAGCGGSITGNGPMTGQGGQGARGGQGGGTTTVPCEAMGACECLAASNRCTVRTEDCWCPSECAAPGTGIDCICGGGRFLSCEDRSTAASCMNELAAVQAKCANHSFAQYIGDICSLSSIHPTCVATCLANLNTTGSCSEIDCSFCPVCDCAAPATPSPFLACLEACRAAPPPERL